MSRPGTPAGRFVVVGNYGSLYSTPVPVEDLQPHPTGVAENLHDVAYGLGKFVAVGNALVMLKDIMQPPEGQLIGAVVLPLGTPTKSQSTPPVV